MMLKVGNCWIYNTTLLDESGNVISESEGIDSSFVSGMKNVGGRQAFEMITYHSFLKDDSVKTDTTYYAVAGSRVYMLLANSVENIVGVCDCLKHEWVEVADCSKKEWAILNKTIMEMIFRS
ncbi:MAG TPA: hypothetical protein VEC36_01390 [Patescibacteria group bacterium]|nr:hypothetical protein [Patescibacteria group bacterium]